MHPIRTLRFAPLAFAALAFSAIPAQAADAPRVSWGKAGVGYEQYLDEAYDCAMVGLGSDISDSEPVEALRTASRQMEALDNRMQGIGNAADPVAAGTRHASDVEAIQAAARPERRVEEIKRLVFPAIQQCMIDRGYTRFALTEAQRAEIAAAGGAEQRRLALHKLASDGAVLEAQQRPLPE